MVQEIHYEVHINKNGRWSIGSNYAKNQMEAAISDGKRAERSPSISAVKVIREVFDTEDGTHQEFIIYKSSNLSYKKVARNTSHNEEGASFQKSHRQTISFNTIFVRVLLVFVLSIGIAIIFTYTTSAILKLLQSVTIFQTNLSEEATFDLLVITFSVSLIFSLIYTGYRFVHLAFLVSKKHDAKNSRNKVSKSQAIDKNDRNSPMAEQPSRNRKVSAQRIAANYLIEKRAAEGQNKTKNLVQDLGIGLIEKHSKETISTQAAVDIGAGRKQFAQDTHNSVQQESSLLYFLKFILADSNTNIKDLDNFNKFGINLFLAGASETLAHIRALKADQKATQLAEVVTIIGFKKSHSATFSRKYEEYLMQDPRYMQMFQSGRNSMHTFSNDKQSAVLQFKSAIAEWNKPKPKEAHSGPITVLFTDIAGSTAMTQTLGDEKAQHVIRTHNRIIREALTDNFGKEIKHTGDGIMAAFNKTTNSVVAAIQMQRQTENYNKSNPDLELHLKIGLNAGEPIAEDNDLFGSTVQMSARIVDKAKGDQIFVSENIKGICAGKGINFINRGGFEMKGFTEPPILYEVDWRQT